MMKEKNWVWVVVLSLLCWLWASCGKDNAFGIEGNGGVEVQAWGKRLATEEKRRVLLFYECGFNSLYNDLRSDANTELDEGLIPGCKRNDNVLLVFSKLAETSSYKPVKSYLRRLYINADDEFVSDTLRVFDESVIAASGETMREVLSFVKDKFPAKSYGMVFSSHGSGWMPPTYYNNPREFERKYYSSLIGASVPMGTCDIHTSDQTPAFGGIPDFDRIPGGDLRTEDPLAHLVRSLGNEKGSPDDHEMDLEEFADGIPFHLDYLLFDMCLTAGVEVVYALRDKADFLGVSAAEVLADGMFDYTKIASFLIGSDRPDLTGLFKDSFDRYDRQSGKMRSSTVNLVRTDGVENLAAVCSTLVRKYRTAIDNAPDDRIQGFFRMDRHYFFDLEDVFAKCGASEDDLALLRDAIGKCVVYRNHTSSFMDAFEIKTYCGFTTYLPCAGTTLLDSYYKEEAWNRAVGIVE